jgi:hypothetical protein
MIKAFFISSLSHANDAISNVAFSGMGTANSRLVKSKAPCMDNLKLFISWLTRVDSNFYCS